MTKLSHTRCKNHSEREAVAQCKECKNYFCRECITEYDERMLCRNCSHKLAKLHHKVNKKRIKFAEIFSLFSLSLFLWIIFYLIGQILLELPELISS